MLEHSLRAVLYAEPKVRLSALLHDVGKPFCFKRDGKYHYHAVEGEKIAEKVLKRLKVDKETILNVKFLVKEHMLDLDGKMREEKVRKFLVKNSTSIGELFMVKEADYKACLDSEDLPVTIVKWREILRKMKEDGTPFSLKELNISSEDLICLGFKGKEIGEELKMLFNQAVLNPKDNNRERLLSLAKGHKKI